MDAGFLVWLLPALALGVGIDAVLLRASSKWVLRQEVGFWRAAAICGLTAAALLPLSLLLGAVETALGLKGGAVAAVSWTLTLAAALTIGGGVIAAMLRTTYRRAIGVAATKIGLGVAVVAAAGLIAFPLLRLTA